jgi:plastocyanin
MGRGRIGRQFYGRLLAGIAISALAAGPLASVAGASTGPVTWEAGAGTANSDQAVQVNAFLPRDLTVDVGDTVDWTIGSGEFHTVTFLSGNAAPPLIVVGSGGPEFNPAAVGPSGGPTYGGTGINNSGLLFQGQHHSVTFTAPGDYGFLCLIHADMKGMLHVQAAGTPYPSTQAQYNVQARVSGAVLTAAGRTLQAKTLADARSTSRTTAAVGAGVLLPDTATLSVMRFLPGKLVVHVGQTVEWNNLDPETPHTITFGTEPAGGPLGAFAPSGVDGPGHATLTSPADSVNSGFVGANLPFGTTFSATFQAPGTYDFICALHDDLGMKGTIVVLP